MNRAEFEKIVMGGTRVWSTSGELVSVVGASKRFVSFELAKTTPFQVRCGCLAIGVPCDWDEPVTFERLMELFGAVSSSDGGLVCLAIQPHFEFHRNNDCLYYYVYPDGSCVTITTMRQVHLLLEAAGVGE